MGNRQPYRDRSNTDATVLTGWYDCDNLKNNSPRNTGLVDLPPVKDNMIWYSPDGGGPVFPTRTDGSGIPTYNAADATYTQPYLRGGGQAIMSGPTYHRDAGQHQQRRRVAGVLGRQVVHRRRVQRRQPGRGHRRPGRRADGSRRRCSPSRCGRSSRAAAATTTLQSWMDAKFGPDGALYMLDYGGGFFSLHPNQKLIRVTYQGGAGHAGTGGDRGGRAEQAADRTPSPAPAPAASS